jgi:hypothetical protein
VEQEVQEVVAALPLVVMVQIQDLMEQEVEVVVVPAPLAVILLLAVLEVLVRQEFVG